ADDQGPHDGLVVAVGYDGVELGRADEEPRKAEPTLFERRDPAVLPRRVPVAPEYGAVERARVTGRGERPPAIFRPVEERMRHHASPPHRGLRSQEAQPSGRLRGIRLTTEHVPIEAHHEVG